jgi:hypothetical protein
MTALPFKVYWRIDEGDWYEGHLHSFNPTKKKKKGKKEMNSWDMLE